MAANGFYARIKLDQDHRAAHTAAKARQMAARAKWAAKRAITCHA